ncbi:hypothetical protein [Sedimentitalea todarodis]|uniref:Calcium-binding protein n=1 Tax=Sedimentitalea todarodis TaxID=1631240 RepID=A0ABU3VB71_9RHOB|nr:hypothetical protein [Sedimentitalea todarodis]MDU9003416.1 hypothetical protein [Sedimentitalea todarodis]
MTVINPVFDGSTPVVRLPGQPDVTWDISSGFMGYYSAFNGTPADPLIANVSLTGSNWTVAAMRFGASASNTTNITDSAGGSNRRIDYLKLGDNSDVDLISTRVRYIDGGEGARHDIQLGSGNTDSVNLGADKNFVITGSGYVGNIDIWNGRGIITITGNAGSVDTHSRNDRITVDGGNLSYAIVQGGADTVMVQNGGYLGTVSDSSGRGTFTVSGDSSIQTLNAQDGNKTVTMNDTSRIQQMRLGNGDHTVTTADRWVDSLVTWDSSNTVTIGTGGIASMVFYSENGETHTITANGYVGSLDTTDRRNDPDDDQGADVTLNTFAGSIRLGNGDDTVQTGDGESGWVELISTFGGNDVVTLGSGGAGAVHASRGDDRINVKELFYNEEDDGVAIRGGSGTDTLSFSAFSEGVAFSLEEDGRFQEVATDAGYFSEVGIENLTGTASADTLTGDTGRNELIGRGGADIILGGGGNDTIKGYAGNDTLYGQAGRDTVTGGSGRDTIDGGYGNDTLSGNGGADIFVFGNNSGTDRVLDFVDGPDTLRLVGHTGGFGDLTFSNANGNREIEHDNGTIVLVGQAGLVLTQADFDFVLA